MVSFTDLRVGIKGCDLCTYILTIDHLPFVDIMVNQISHRSFLISKLFKVVENHSFLNSPSLAVKYQIYRNKSAS